MVVVLIVIMSFDGDTTALPTAPVNHCTNNSTSSSSTISSIASSSSSHEGSMVVQHSADNVTQIGRVFARQLIRELTPLHMDNDGWIDAEEM